MITKQLPNAWAQFNACVVCHEKDAGYRVIGMDGLCQTCRDDQKREAFKK